MASATLNALCDVPGLRVGHMQNMTAQTGCTVILPDSPAFAAVDVRGCAPGTREVETLQPTRLIEQIHGLCLSGGSAFGLDTAGGVQKYLEEQGTGFDTGVARVPIVPSAVIFDLATGDANVRPDAGMGYSAAAAASAEDASRGKVGAGTGATVAKALGMEHCSPGGLGQASERLDDGVVVSALAVVNAFGDVIEPGTGRILAGMHNELGGYLPTPEYLRNQAELFSHQWTNTTLVAVATNAAFDKTRLAQIAVMAQDGLARAINPVHTLFDGDIVFALSCGDKKAHPVVVGTVAAEVVARAIVDAVTTAGSQT